MKCLLKRLSLIIVVFFVGCAPFQNLSVEDVKNKKNYLGENHLAMSLAQADYCLQKTNYNCGDGPVFSRNPDSLHEATIFVYGLGGLTHSNPYVIIEFSEIGKDMCTYKSYTALTTWNSQVPKIIDRISACGDCSKL